MAKFFQIRADDVVKRIATDYESIASHCSAEVASIDKIFGQSAQLVPYYISPDAQNANPADHPEDDTGLVSRESIFKMMDKFLGGDPQYAHAIVLSDAGMGKTSLLMMLKLAALDQLIKGNFTVVLLKLGEGTSSQVGNITNPAETILLLDALDEDREAWTNFYTRLQEILLFTQSFRKTIITCRTQFFPIQHEKDGRVPGLIKLHGFECAKVFISPFDDDQVEEYLIKRFADEAIRKKAQRIVMRMKSLKFRPMLLSYVDLLIDRESNYDNVYDLYDQLVDAWLDRELKKGVIGDKQPLLVACEAVALEMFKSKARIIESSEIERICQASGCLKQLEEMSVEGRSMLHRTSEGGYKFAHYTMLEYFVARHLAVSLESMRTSDQIRSFLLDMITSGRLRRIRDLDLRECIFGKITIHGLEAQRARFDGGTILNCDFAHGAMNGASFENTVIEGTKLSKANLTESRLVNAKLSHVDLAGARLAGADFSGVVADNINIGSSALNDVNFGSSKFERSDFRSAILTNIIFTRSAFVDSSFENANFIKCDLRGSNFKGSSFKGCRPHNLNFSGSDLSNCLFTESVMNGAIFEECTLDGADFAKTSLNAASFKDSIARDANFVSCKAVQSIFLHSDFSHSDFSDAELNDAGFSYVDLTETRFDRSEMARVNLEFTKLQNASFFEANLDGANFEKAVGTSAQFQQANLQWSKFITTQIIGGLFRGANLTKATFWGSCLRRCNFSGARLDRTDFHDTDLSESDLTDLDLTLARLDGAKLIGALCIRTKLRSMKKLDMASANFGEADLAGVDGEGARLQGANLTKAKMVGAQLRGALLQSAVLREADLTSSILQGADFTNADIRGAIFTDSKLDNALFKDTIFDDDTVLPTTLSASQVAGLRRLESIQGIG